MLCFRCGSYNPENAPKCSVCGQSFVDEGGRVVGPQRKPSQTAVPAGIFVPGEMVAGRYRISEMLGQGGVGAVFRARDTEIDVDVALKGISANLLQTEEEQKNFSKQIRAARKLQHPNIVRVYDEGQAAAGGGGSRRFFTMKLLEGLTLRKIIRLRHEKGQPFTGEELVPIFHQLAAALDYAHKTTWHGDLKPENVIILPDLLKVTDFHLIRSLPLKPFMGIAKSRGKGFQYLAPELRVEAQTIDGRADIYSLGVILAEMLTGLVFEGHYTRAMTAALEQLPTKLDGLVRKALTEHPDGRFSKASEMAREIEAALGAMTSPLPPPQRPQQPVLSGPNERPAEKPTARPPTPPPDTGADHPALKLEAPAAQVSSAEPSSDGLPPPPLDELREPSDILEIGQSQVLLLQSGVTQQPPGLSDATSGELADAAKRLLRPGTESHPDDHTIDEGTSAPHSDVSTAPRGAPPVQQAPQQVRPGRVSSGDRLRDPDQLIESLYRDEGDENLIPPPLPGDEEERSLDAPVTLPGDDDDDSAEDTGEHPRLSEDIHDALTDLKRHPRPDLLDEPSEESAPAEPSSSRSRPSSRDDARPELSTSGPIDNDDDSLKETLSADVLRAARERSSPRLHAADALPPPVVAPPPVLRPVAPPERRREGPNAVAILAGIAALVVLALVVVKLTRKPEGEDLDHAVVGPTADAGSEGREIVVSPTPDDTQPIPVSADAGARVDPAVNGTPVDAKPVDAKPVDAKPVDTKPVDVALLTKPADTKPADTKPADAKPDDAKPTDTKPTDGSADTKPVDVAVLVAPTGTCPKGTATVDGGAFSFGSAPGDSMRNFGEADAQNVTTKTFCIDYYEYENGKDTIPVTGVTWQAAKTACERKGKRLCTEAEWERACKGPSGTRFPYGNSYDASVCNTEDAEGKPRALAAAIDFKKCRSGFKAFMMAGNAEEWVADSSGGQKIAKGGAADRPDFASRCSARRLLSARTTSPTLGFRCCADPK